jgi:hypothetical protein
MAFDLAYIFGRGVICLRKRLDSVLHGLDVCQLSGFGAVTTLVCAA